MIITYDDFPNIRRQHKSRTIILATGSFDLLHAGHIVFFEDCKKLGDILIVGIGNDEACRQKALDRPILNEHQRLKVLDNIRLVDYSFIHKTPPKESKLHNVFIEEILQKLRPDKWVMIKESSEIPYRQKISDKYGVELVLTDRHCPPEYEGISTTKIIEKIRGKKSPPRKF
jgi:D-glycero-beta-D-manno-heptose 1-phosphate adenylyltransferase